MNYYTISLIVQSASRTFFVYRLPLGHVSLRYTHASIVPELWNDSEILIGRRSRGTMVWIFYRGQKREVRVSEFCKDRDRNTSQFGHRPIGSFLCPYTNHGVFPYFTRYNHIMNTSAKLTPIAISVVQHAYFVCFLIGTVLFCARFEIK